MLVEEKGYITIEQLLWQFWNGLDEFNAAAPSKMDPIQQIPQKFFTLSPCMFLMNPL